MPALRRGDDGLLTRSRHARRDPGAATRPIWRPTSRRIGTTRIAWRTCARRRGRGTPERSRRSRSPRRSTTSGIWIDHTFDYLEPSVRLAREHLLAAGRAAWVPDVTAAILEHHRISRYRGDARLAGRALPPCRLDGRHRRRGRRRGCSRDLFRAALATLAAGRLPPAARPPRAGGGCAATPGIRCRC